MGDIETLLNVYDGRQCGGCGIKPADNNSNGLCKACGWDNSDGQSKEIGSSIWEYGLAFDYVAPGTFKDQRKGYWRYQISWGGPSEEIRFYAPKGTPEYLLATNAGAAGWDVGRVMFSFMDWFDGEHRALSGRARRTAVHLWNHLADCGSVEAAYTKGMEGFEP